MLDSVIKRLMDPYTLLLVEYIGKLGLLETESSISSTSGFLLTVLLENDGVTSNGNISSARAFPLVTSTVSPLSGFSFRSTISGTLQATVLGPVEKRLSVNVTASVDVFIIDLLLFRYQPF